MSKLKFKFSKTIPIHSPTGISMPSHETFEVSDADSWDEARKVVEKGVYERQLELDAETKKRHEEMKKNPAPAVAGSTVAKGPGDMPVIPPSTGGPVPAPNKLNPPPTK